MAIELELKLRICELTESSLIVGKLKELLPDSSWELKSLDNVYFDTAQLALNNSKIALRLRAVGNNKWIQTLKTQGKVVDGLHRRGEWEWELDERQLDLESLNGCEAWPLALHGVNLVPVFETNFNRYKSVMAWQGATIELAYDAGEILSGGKTDRINEIEIELVSGEAEAVKHLGRYLQEHMSLELYDVSKAERGYRLYGA